MAVLRSEPVPLKIRDELETYGDRSKLVSACRSSSDASLNCGRPCSVRWPSGEGLHRSVSIVTSTSAIWRPSDFMLAHLEQAEWLSGVAHVNCYLGILTVLCRSVCIGGSVSACCRCSRSLRGMCANYTRSATSAVWRSNSAVVTGPTPPGTGVIAEARVAAATSTSPIKPPSGVGLVPTSMTTAPSLR